VPDRRKRKSALNVYQVRYDYVEIVYDYVEIGARWYRNFQLLYVLKNIK